ncbi:cytochrome P450 3A8-like isoform X2 [Ornithodoros turicata]|uniref:cytochrome P450 3A8-like isoform X2 n=1 Tax=Ornithodoros turicata TaxID=34597 RepID=UPI003139EC7C
MLWAVGLALCFVCIAALVRWRKKQYSVFKDMDVPGPEPNLLWGNLFEYENGLRVPALTKWCKKYGDIFGIYLGDVPFLVVKDLDILQSIFIKDFNIFTDRGYTTPTDEEHPFLGNSIIQAKGSRWKTLRTCITQGFTSNKLKQMIPHISHAADMFIDILSEKADTGKEFPMLKAFRGLSMDYVGRAAFGIENTFQRDLDHPFLTQAIETLPGIMRGFFHILTYCTRTLGTFISPILWLHSQLGSFTYVDMNKQTAKVVELRKKNPSLWKADLLQGLIDSETTDQGDDEGNSGKKLSANNGKKLSTDDVCLNSTILFVAGFETTATALSYVIFNVAKHPDVQEKLRAEVRKAVDESGNLDFNSTMGLKYMKQVFDETLRMYPPGVTFTTRRALEDVEYKGLKIKAGTCIMAPTYQIHMDQRYWPDPERFDPERFSPENRAHQHPMAYQAFGMGPRNCVGMRLAILEIMYTVARMLLKFRIELGDSQEGKMNMGYYAMVSVPGNDLWIKIYKI